MESNMRTGTGRMTSASRANFMDRGTVFGRVSSSGNLMEQDALLGLTSDSSTISYVEQDGLLGILWPLQDSLNDGQSPLTDASATGAYLQSTRSRSTATATTNTLTNTMARESPFASLFSLPPQSIFGDVGNRPQFFNPLTELVEGDELAQRGIVNRASIGRGRGAVVVEHAGVASVGVGRGGNLIGRSGAIRDLGGAAAGGADGLGSSGGGSDTANNTAATTRQQRLRRKPTIRRRLLLDAPFSSFTSSHPHPISPIGECPTSPGQEEDAHAHSDDDMYHPGDTYICSPCRKQPRKVIIKIVKSPLVLAQEAEEARELARQHAAYYTDRQPYTDRYTKYMDYWRYAQEQRQDEE